MVVTVIMWFCVILLSLLALGFLGCAVLMILGMIGQRNDREMVLLYGVMTLISALASAGLVIAVIALGRSIP